MAQGELPDRSWQTRRRLAMEVAALRDDPRDPFAGIPDDLLDRYLNGQATDAERAEIDVRKEGNPWLQEAIEALQWAFLHGRELPEPPLVPWPSLFAVPLPLRESPAQAWARIAEQLRAIREMDQKVWGGIDVRMVARSLTGTATPDERETVERVLANRPGLRQAVEVVREVLQARAAERREQQQMLGGLVLALSFAALRRCVVQVRQYPPWLGEKCSVGTESPAMRGGENPEQPLIEFEDLIVRLTPSAAQLGVQVFSRLHRVEGLKVQAIDEAGQLVDAQSTDADGCVSLAVPCEGSCRLVIHWPGVPDEGKP